ncbi:MAG TPA: hypothetical protein VEX68_14800 [Bryobacteraceae bacterium]|nr:hypothetical protein [Bryobacteraceae bacterium]
MFYRKVLKLIYQFLPYAHRISASRQPFFDELAVWLRGARNRGGVGGHLIGRFCRSALSPATWRADRNACGSQIRSRGFPSYARCLLDSAQGLAQLAQRNDLVLLFFAQDIAHVDGSVSSAGFNVPICCFYWPVFR